MADNEFAAGQERGTTDRTKDKAQEMKDQAQEKVSSATAEARHKGSELVEEGKEKARELGHRAEEKARSRAEEQRHRVSDGIRSVADALRRGSEKMPEEQREYSRFLNGVADRVEGVSRYLEEHDVDSITREVRRVARDHSPVFLSGAFTLGMLGARFLKSSGGDPYDDRFESEREPRGYGRYAGSPRDTGYGQYQPEDRFARELRDRGVGRATETTPAPGREASDRDTTGGLGEVGNA